MLKQTVSGICAGIMIAIGGSVFLSCDNRVVGAILFSVALLCICFKGYALFTGRVGFLPDAHTKADLTGVLGGLLGNAIATTLLGWVVRYATPVGDKAYLICSAKLDQAVGQTLIRAVLCGVLMYLAVSIYKEGKGIAGILFCVPVFILSGFEHSIANMFYFAASGMVSLQAFGYLWLVIAGNAVGGMLLPLLHRIGAKKEVNHG